MDQNPNTARRTRTSQSARASQAARAARTSSASARASRTARTGRASSAPAGKRRSPAETAGKSRRSAAGRASYPAGRDRGGASARRSGSAGASRARTDADAARRSAERQRKQAGYRRNASGARSGGASRVRTDADAARRSAERQRKQAGYRRNASGARSGGRNVQTRGSSAGGAAALQSVADGFRIAGKALAFFAGEALRLLRTAAVGIAAFFASLKTRLRPLLVPGVMIPGVLKWAAFAGLALLLFRSVRKVPVSDTPFDVMSGTVTEAAELSNTVQGDNQIIKRLYGLTPSDYDGVLLYCPVTNMGAEELLLVRLRDSSQEQQVMDAIGRRLETQLTNFNGYGVDQTETLENSVSLSEGGYCLFYSGDDPQNVRSALKSAL